ncbi:MAG: HAD-IA family hydrolase [Pseudomonadota bacterium]
MKPKALFLGAIGVLAETSDIQRRAYNQALAEAGLTWHWDRETYRELLSQPGGIDRLRRLNDSHDAALNEKTIGIIHARKTELACEQIISQGIPLRPGVADTIGQALEFGIKVALVTTTYRANIEAIAEAAGPALRFEAFSAVLTREDCAKPKPSPDIYFAALRQLGLDASDVVAVEDSSASVASAKAAGLYTIATPGAFTAGQDFSDADEVLVNLHGYSLLGTPATREQVSG